MVFLVVTQHESSKTININLTQEASTVSYTYELTVNPTSLSFVNTGEVKNITVTSTKQAIINGKPSGVPTNIGTDIEVAGVGFSYEVVESGFDIKVGENPSDKVRTGTATITMDEGGKSATINLSQVASVITYEYSLTPTPTSISFVAVGESKSFNVVSVKQKKLNGKNSGSPVNIDYTTIVSGTGFSKGNNATTVIAAENTTETQRTGKVAIATVEGNKTAEITLTQAAAVVTYDYTLTTNPTSLSFAAEGETKVFGVTSNKQKKVNGKNSGPSMAVNYTTVVSGEGFSKGSSEYSVIASANTGVERVGKAVVTASEGGKSATINLTQVGV